MPDKTVLGQNMVLDIDMLTKLSVFHDLENRGGGNTIGEGLHWRGGWLRRCFGCPT